MLRKYIDYMAKHMKLILSVLVLMGAIFTFNAVQNSQSDAALVRDCNSNSILYCGAETIGELRDKYNSNGDAQAVYGWYGVTSAMVNGSAGSLREGTVWKDGRITLDNGELVATGARSAGWEWAPNAKFITGVASRGFYDSAPNDSFLSDSISAFVWLDGNGRFIGAVIKSCGNPTNGVPTKEEPPVQVQVCDPSTGNIITVNESEKDKYVTVDSPKCKDIQLCRLSDKQVVTIKQAVYDNNPTAYSSNLDDCKSRSINIEKTVSLSKTDRGQETLSVMKDQEFFYTLVVKNTGELDLKNVHVLDNAPDGIRFISSDQPGLTGNQYSYFISKLKSGASFKIIIRAASTRSSAKPVLNTACVNAPEINPGQPTAADDCDDASTTTPNPAVSIDKTVALEKASQGGEIIQVKLNHEFFYTLVVKNIGDMNLTNFVVTDNAPAGIQFISTDKGIVKDNKYSYAISQLKVGESVTIKIRAKATKISVKPVVNEACVNTPDVPGDKDDCDDASTTTPEPNKVAVCDPTDRTIKQVNEDDADKYLPVDSPKCQTMKVCVIETGELNKTIFKDEFDSKKYSTNEADCKKLPTYIPSTGVETTIGSVFGIGSLTFGLYTFAASRRALFRSLQ